MALLSGMFMGGRITAGKAGGETREAYGLEQLLRVGDTKDIKHGSSHVNSKKLNQSSSLMLAKVIVAVKFKDSLARYFCLSFTHRDRCCKE